MAYQVVGDGPADLLFVPNLVPNLDIAWDHPPFERFFRRLASFSRLILFNQLGNGVSDGVAPGTTITPEENMQGVREVLSAVGSQRATVFATEAGGMPAMFFAVTFPERIRSLVLLDSYATLRRRDDYAWGLPPPAMKRWVDQSIADWGTGKALSQLAPELMDDERFRDWYARFERLSTGPSNMATQMRALETWDARGILASIKTPTLVLAHTRHPWIRVEHGRYIGDHIPGAQYVERQAFCGLYWIHDTEWILDEVQAFVTGTRAHADLEDRVLATVLFTDIVSSTERAAELGDRRWRQLLDEHDTLVHREIDRFRGRALKSTGDGIMATFDGPARAIRCAGALNDAVRSLGIEIRTGLHTGEVEQRGEDVGGIAVHIAARVMSEAGPSEVLVSGAVPPLVAGSGLEFDDRGSHELKGVPGEWRLYSVNP